MKKLLALCLASIAIASTGIGFAFVLLDDASPAVIAFVVATVTALGSIIIED